MSLHRHFAVLGGVLAALIASAPGAAQDRSFTIAVIPDSQNYLDYTHQTAEGFPFDAREMFLRQMRYVAANTKSSGGDIAFVTSVGDIWQHPTLAMDPAHAARGFQRGENAMVDQHLAPTPKAREVEMPDAREAYDLIAGKVPFSVVPGNHDYDAVWSDARYPGPGFGTLHAGGLDNFRSVFGADTAFFGNKDWYVASHDGGADSAQIFEAGGYRFLHIGLQFDAPDASLAWAAGVIAKHARLPTIVTLHDYMNNKGERVSNPIIAHAAIDPQDNSPQMIWDKLISQHDQIFLVLCGHQEGQAIRVDANRQGHAVVQVLADYQHRAQSTIAAGRPTPMGDGWLRLMRFDMAGEAPKIHVRTYSTHFESQSVDTPDYARWYKPREKPEATDAEFHARDDFVVTLGDFRARFGAGRP